MCAWFMYIADAIQSIRMKWFLGPGLCNCNKIAVSCQNNQNLFLFFLVQTIPNISYLWYSADNIKDNIMIKTPANRVIDIRSRHLELNTKIITVGGWHDKGHGTEGVFYCTYFCIHFLCYASSYYAAKQLPQQLEAEWKIPLTY